MSRVHPESDVRLHDILDHKEQTFTYVYDFGDDWHHELVVEEILETESDRCGLAQLHDVIQAAMGWEHSHFHEFRIDGNRYGVSDEGFEDPSSRVHPENDVRLHDLRHSFASVGAAGGMGLPIVGKLLGHTQAQTTARYAHLDNDPLKRASEQIANTIAAALEGG